MQGGWVVRGLAAPEPDALNAQDLYSAARPAGIAAELWQAEREGNLAVEAAQTARLARVEAGQALAGDSYSPIGSGSVPASLHTQLGVAGDAGGIRAGSLMLHAALEGEGSSGANGGARFVNPATTVGEVLPERVMFGACFLPGTLIQTQEGLRAIERLAAGEWVAGRSEASGKTTWRRVVQTFRTENKQALAVKVRHADGQLEEIQATTEHPFYVEGKKWCAANELEKGDQLALLDGSHSTMVSVASLPELYTVYNFEVEVDHTYFVGGRGVWVHNTSRISLDGVNAGAAAKAGAPQYQEIVDQFASLPSARSYKAWKNGLLDVGVDLSTISDAIHEGTLKRGENLWGSNWKRYYEEVSNTKFPGDPYHAHHLVEKEGLSDAAAQNRQILQDAGIDPYLNRNNLTWAPNVAGQHGNIPQEQLLEMLMPVRGNQAGIYEVLNQWAKISQAR